MTRRWEHVLAVERVVKADRRHLLNLSSNELQHPQLRPLLEALIAEAIEADLFCRYPTYQARLERLAAHHGVSVDSVLIAAGSDDAIRLVLQAMAAADGRLILQTPNYAGWQRHAQLLGLAVIPVRFGADESNRYTIRQFIDALATHEPCVVAISNPNGPTGAWLDAHDLSTLHVACSQRGHVLVVDECYRGFDGNETDVGPDIDDHLVRIRSFSKAYGLAGSRVASIVASPGVVDYLARYCPEFAVSGPTLAMLGPALDRAASFCALRRDVMASRDWLVARVEEIKPEWEPLPTRANFINFRTSGSSEARDIAGRLLQAGIRVKTTDGLPGLDGCVRFTLTERSLLAPLVQGLAAAAEGAHA